MLAICTRNILSTYAIIPHGTGNAKSFVKHWTCRIGCGILVDSTIGLA